MKILHTKDREMKLFRHTMMAPILPIIVLVLVLSSCTPAASPATETPIPPSPTPEPFELTSPAFETNTPIPVRHTCHGEELSPALAWSAPPSGTQSLVLVMEDPDAVQVVGRAWDHWVLFNLPVDTISLSEGIPQEVELPDGGQQGWNSSFNNGYSGPCPPGGQTHKYVFTLYAVDTRLNLEATANKAEVLEAMEGHILAQTELIGQYTSP
jgi:Raf kinase inhibitor-like YbhB/YbcL family protein